MRRGTLLAAASIGWLAAFAFPARADTAGERLLQRCERAEQECRGFTARFTHQFDDGTRIQVQAGALDLEKPNLAHIVVDNPDHHVEAVVINSDGRTFVTYSAEDDDYHAEAADLAGGNVARNNVLETSIFFDPDLLARYRYLARSVRVGARVTVGRTACRELVFQGIPNVDMALYIGPDGLLRGVRKRFRGLLDETHITDLRVWPEIPRQAFAWTPPKGARTAEQVAASMALQQPGQAGSSMLRAGTSAPPFTLKLADGREVTLSAALRGKRALILNFWSCF